MISLLILCLLGTCAMPLYGQQNVQDLSFQDLDSIANHYSTTSKFDLALKFGQIALDKAIIEFGEQDSTVAHKLRFLGSIYLNKSNFQKAKELWIQAKDIQAITLGKNSLEYGYTIGNLAIAHYYLEEMDAAIACAKEQLHIMEHSNLQSGESYVLAIRKLASLYMETDKYEAAEGLFLQCLEIQANSSGKNTILYATTINNLAILYEYMNRFKKAEAMHLQALAIKSKILGPKDLEFVSSLDNLAILYEEMGDYEKAEPLYLKALAINKEILGETHLSFAISLYNLSTLYIRLSRFHSAETLMLQVKNIYEKKLGKEHPKYALTLNSLATIFSKQKKYEQALQYYFEAKKILEKKPKKSTYKILLTNIGLLYQKLKQYDLAETFLLEALGQDKNKTNNQIYTNQPLALQALATTYVKMNRYEEAERFFEISLANQKQLHGIHYSGYLKDLNNLAYTSWTKGDVPKTFEYLALALELNCKTTNNTSIQTLEGLEVALQQNKVTFYSNNRLFFTLQILSRYHQSVYVDSNEVTHLKKAFLAAQLGILIHQKISKGFNSNEDKLATTSKLFSLIEHAIVIGLELTKIEKTSFYLEEIFHYSEQSKSILLADATKTSKAHKMGDLPDSLMLLEQQFQKQKDRLQKAAFEAKNKQSMQGILRKQNTLNVKIDAFLKSLKNKYPHYHSLKYKSITTSSKEVQAILTPDALLLEYLVTDTSTYLIVLSKTTLEIFPIKIKKDSLQEAIRSLRMVLSDYEYIVNNSSYAKLQYAKRARWFYKTLLAPALKDKKNIQQLIIIPDFELGHLPFEVFLTKEEDQYQSKTYKDMAYLVNDYRISYNYSATLWKENLAYPIKNSNGKILACASDYDTKLAPSLELHRGPYLHAIRRSLTSLPAAQTEVQTLSTIINGRFLSGMNCTEAVFKKEAPNYSIIHLAMHGILHKRIPILSSLAFTENLDSLEDNFLQAYEISALKLNTQLVVLSACETGYGKFEQGEGVMSMARSFMYAGAPSLVVSLWQVNDNSTAIIMQNFYQNLADGLQKNEALRQAKLSYIHQSDGLVGHPAFWSPFIQIGDYQAIQIDNKKTSWKPYLIGTGILLIFFLFFVRSRKKQISL